ncbi:hypothetical protein AWN76_007915 [Rhodothermaceae bacterium RA]|nr:hypothetical protein AWN76_007915 [Rhodothermaceae bacterium RA]
MCRMPFHTLLPVAGVLLLAGCSLFSPREPEAPTEAGGTYEQPDTPEQVVANLQAAIAELNTQNYRRSLAEDLVFEPTATAMARTPALWSTWSRQEEDAYFSTLVASARFGSGHELELREDVLSFVTGTRAQLDALYVLTVHHRRAGVPTTVEGRLIWELTQDASGLWHLSRWIDREVGNAPAWSDLKAAFVQ